MAHSSHGKGADRPGYRPSERSFRIISWNLLHLAGAGVPDVAALVKRYRPDFLLMQEATQELAVLPSVVGGHFFREPLFGRRYGLAVWSPRPLGRRPHAFPLPVSTMPGRVPPRVAQIIHAEGITLANVHLSHGQFLNRWQLLRIARFLDGPAAIVGDYNAVGPIMLDGFEDIGPARSTLTAGNVISFRLDRCMARGLVGTGARVLERGPSDHHPIVLDLRVRPEVSGTAAARSSRGSASRRNSLRVGMVSWLRSLSLSPSHIRIPRDISRTAAAGTHTLDAARGPHPARREDEDTPRVTR